MIRIISGALRHRQINQPPSEQVRPTQDRVREAIFSALGPIDGYRKALDLFAGSGAFGFECLSRGVQEVYFVDALKLAYRAIEKTISEFHLEDRSHLLLADYRDGLKKLSDHKFDLVFFDPPYQMDVTYSTIEFLLEHQMVNTGSRIVVESQKAPPTIEGFSLKTYRYGIRFVGIYRRTI